MGYIGYIGYIDKNADTKDALATIAGGILGAAFLPSDKWAIIPVFGAPTIVRMVEF